jgi:hypothetical protein
VAEVYAKRGRIKGVQQYHITESRRFKERYSRASSPRERSQVWRDVREFNKQFPRSKWITLGDLRRDISRRRRDARKQGTEVLKLNPRDRYLSTYGDAYNVR